MYPIYIPTKGRAGNVKTYHLLQECGLNATLSVEPQEFEEYSKAYPEAPLLRLKKNDQGLAYSRQSILDHARQVGEGVIWQLDDDLTQMTRWNRTKGKFEKCTAKEGLTYVEKVFDRYSNVALAMPQFNFFPEYGEGASINTHVYGFILQRTDTGVNYLLQRPWIEDLGFALETLKLGWCTMQVHGATFNAPVPGTQPGGCTPEYHDGSMNAGVEACCAAYPDFVTLYYNNKKGMPLARGRFKRSACKQVLKLKKVFKSK